MVMAVTLVAAGLVGPASMALRGSRMAPMVVRVVWAVSAAMLVGPRPLTAVVVLVVRVVRAARAMTPRVTRTRLRVLPAVTPALVVMAVPAARRAPAVSVAPTVVAVTPAPAARAVAVRP